VLARGHSTNDTVRTKYRPSSEASADLLAGMHLPSDWVSTSSVAASTTHERVAERIICISITLLTD